MDEYYEVLGLDPAIYREQGTTPSEKEISKAYRKACVKVRSSSAVHPAGGSLQRVSMSIHAQLSVPA